MAHAPGFRPALRRSTAFAATLLLLVTSTSLAASVVRLSSDPYTNTTSQHQTEVEPDSFSFGTTIVSATQVGRFTDGGSSNIGWATSTNGGASWTNGFLPGITVFAGGTYDRVSDPAVAYDAKHNVWLISTLAITVTTSVNGAAVLTSRSTDGGLTWGSPVITFAGGDVDKNWIACDNTAASPFYGNCYTEYDRFDLGDLLQMSTSSDGGLTWGASQPTGNNATGLGGQPVVQPNGTVVVPASNANESAIIAFRSTNGGASWSSSTTISAVKDHLVAGSLRTGPLPSAETDGAGKVYVVWQDCRFRRGCKSNDIVLSTSLDGLTWSSVARVPIDGTSSKVDHFIPGLGVDQTTSGATTRLGLAYYYYPVSNCSASTCQLDIGFISSTNGGSNWNPSVQLTGPMALGWLPNTTQGRMVGDYISTSFSGGVAFPLFSAANAPTGTTFDQGMFTTATGLTVSAGSIVLTSSGEHPVPGAASDHASAQAPITHR